MNRFSQNNTDNQAPLFEHADKLSCLEALEDVLNPAKKNKGVLLKVYLENFRALNDTFGYEHGGLLIEDIGRFLLTIPGAAVFRLAGVEFIVILDRAGHGKALQVAQDICERFDHSWNINGIDCLCSVSIGVAFYPNHAESIRDMLYNLDQAVMEAASTGFNRMAVYDEELEAKIYRRRSIAQSIPVALENSLVEIRYRPTACMESGTFTRAEGYFRLLHEEFGIITAAEFIPIAEESGQICAVGLYAIKKTCALIRSFLDDGIAFESIAVPLSPVQLFQENFVDDMKALLDEHSIPEKKLAFEISESVLISSFASVHVVLHELEGLGIELILNDFGSGYSGVNNVLAFPVDVLKLERMFVWQLETNPRSSHVIDGLIRIAKGLGLKIIAEGVETQNQKDLLSSFGCPYEQGFYYSPTVTPDELKALLGKPATQYDDR